jgi:hypothetical protein
MKQFTKTHYTNPNEDNTLGFTQPEQHYHMAVSTREHYQLNAFVGQHSDDPAMKGSCDVNPPSELPVTGLISRILFQNSRTTF